MKISEIEREITKIEKWWEKKLKKKAVCKTARRAHSQKNAG